MRWHTRGTGRDNKRAAMSFESVEIGEIWDEMRNSFNESDCHCFLGRWLRPVLGV